MRQPRCIPAILLALALCLCPIAVQAQGVTFGESRYHVESQHIWLEEALDLPDGGYLLVGGLYGDPMWINSDGPSMAPAAWQFDEEHRLVSRFIVPDAETAAYFTHGAALPNGRFAFTCAFWEQTDAKTLSVRDTSLMIFSSDGALEANTTLDHPVLALYVQKDVLCIASSDILDLAAGIKEPRVAQYDLQGNLLGRKNYTLGHLWAFFDHALPVTDGLLVGGSLGHEQNASFIAWLSEATGVSIWNHTVHGTETPYLSDCHVTEDGGVVTLLRHSSSHYGVQKISDSGEVLLNVSLDVAENAMPLDILETAHGLLAIGVINAEDIAERYQFATLIDEDGMGTTTFNSSISQPGGLLQTANGQVYLYGIEMADGVQAVILTELHFPEDTMSK